jgi:hydroxymethylglutaryl-CoA reductase
MYRKPVERFSKMSKSEKINWLASHTLSEDPEAKNVFKDYWLTDISKQKTIDGFSENTISNFVLPYGIAPNFLIDGTLYCIPMVIEESSVVAAASSAAKYWLERGGFHTTILGTQKVGQVHFKWKGQSQLLRHIYPKIEQYLIQQCQAIVENMQKRGGGIANTELLDFTGNEPHLYQIRVHFETCDSMGANFINSVLENFATSLERFFVDSTDIPEDDRDIDIIMAILSNYTPECVARAEVFCPIKDLGTFANGMLAEQLAEKFNTAVSIAHFDPYRAATHNKGIFNGVDAVVLATGNDFRAVEAAGHTYAARHGSYKSLSYCQIKDGMFRFWLDLPLALGTVGGLTSLHPLAKKSLQILGNPSAEQLMRIVTCVGLAQNFAAVRSLVTTGIQQGHMKMHLQNILNHIEATDEESQKVSAHFEDKTISFAAVRDFIKAMR